MIYKRCTAQRKYVSFIFFCRLFLSLLFLSVNFFLLLLFLSKAWVCEKVIFALEQVKFNELGEERDVKRIILLGPEWAKKKKTGREENWWIINKVTMVINFHHYMITAITHNFVRRSSMFGILTPLHFNGNGFFFQHTFFVKMVFLMPLPNKLLIFGQNWSFFSSSLNYEKWNFDYRFLWHSYFQPN